MAIAFDRPGIEALHARLAPYARGALDRCGEYALQIHADEVGPEHLLSTLMDDEDCAAHRVVVHAFADPASISEEARALSAGILISGSAATLPFSPLGVRALKSAREHAAQRRDAQVEVPHLLLAACAQLPEALRATLDDAGWSAAGVEALLGPGGKGPVSTGGPLFRCFSDDAKRLLSAAAKLARAGAAPSVSAAHLLLAGVQSGLRFERAACVPAARVRLALRGRSEDTSRVEGGPVPVDGPLEGFLRALPAGADTLEMLSRFLGGELAELAQALRRQRVSAELIERSRGVFRDPA